VATTGRGGTNHRVATLGGMGQAVLLLASEGGEVTGLVVGPVRYVRHVRPLASGAVAPKKGQE